MTATGTEIHDAIVDLLVDEDGELLLGEALTVLLQVAAGLCRLAEPQSRSALAAEFGTKLLRLVAQEPHAAQAHLARRLLS